MHMNTAHHSLALLFVLLDKGTDDAWVNGSPRTFTRSHAPSPSFAAKITPGISPANPSANLFAEQTQNTTPEPGKGDRMAYVTDLVLLPGGGAGWGGMSQQMAGNSNSEKSWNVLSLCTHGRAESSREKHEEHAEIPDSFFLITGEHLNKPSECISPGSN